MPILVAVGPSASREGRLARKRCERHGEAGREATGGGVSAPKRGASARARCACSHLQLIHRARDVEVPLHRHHRLDLLVADRAAAARSCGAGCGHGCRADAFASRARAPTRLVSLACLRLCCSLPSLGVRPPRRSPRGRPAPLAASPQQVVRASYSPTPVAVVVAVAVDLEHPRRVFGSAPRICSGRSSPWSVIVKLAIICAMHSSVGCDGSVTGTRGGERTMVLYPFAPKMATSGSGVSTEREPPSGLLNRHAPTTFLIY